MLLLPVFARAQSDMHYTMFMYNKLLYNPGYTGSRDVTSFNANYRDQWAAIQGAPKTINVSIDAPVGSYMKAFRKVALGFTASNEKTGVESNTNLRAYYAYRIKFSKSVLSLGLSGGVNLYSAAYDQLSLNNQNDPNFSNNIKNEMLPNFGAGAYWSGNNFYLGLSVPNLLQNNFDKHEIKLNDNIAQQIRGYYLGGGYVFDVGETIKLEPQVLMRYAADANHQLPFNTDFNISAIVFDRLLIGATYRTDKSVEGIIHLQVTSSLNIGYAYDYVLSGLNGYSGGTHEIVLGFDLLKEHSKYLTPRFIKKF
jgi:type IX secretion system PorP/SprF family membrane protein